MAQVLITNIDKYLNVLLSKDSKLLNVEIANPDVEIKFNGAE